MMGKSWYKDKQGKFITSEELEPLLRDNDYRIVKQEVIGNKFFSTVWMGVPHGCKEPYHYFETIVFKRRKEGGDPREDLGQELEVYRYHSLKEAQEGHEIAVKEWKDEP